MHRLLRLSFLMVLFGILAFSQAIAQEKPRVYVSGRVSPTDVRVFMKDSVYVINRDYVIGGTLLIEPGTTVLFYANGRLIDSVGGRIIADGFAKATYVPNPIVPAGVPNAGWTTADPLYPDYPMGKNNRFDYEDYSDLNYFLYNTAYLVGDNTNQRVINLETKRDVTVNSAKYHLIFNIVLDKANRTIKNLRDPNNVILGADGLWYVDDGTMNNVIIPFEQAIMFTAARLAKDPADDIDLRRYPWTRVEVYEGAATSVNVGTGNATTDRILFKGQPENNVSREWGHILIMPGAKTAFFRNCTFEHFKKDTTVDRTPLYIESTNGADPFYDNHNWAYINNRLRLLTNGTGGAFTTLSSRTWLIDCEFKDNRARHKGGALAILQVPNFTAPNNFPKDHDGVRFYDIYNPLLVDRYPIDKNPNLTDKNGAISSINRAVYDEDDFIPGLPKLDVDGRPILAVPGDPTTVELSVIPAIDLIDEAGAEPTFNYLGDASKADFYRQAFDDGRIALYLGRMRNLTFTNNLVQLAHVATKVLQTNPPTFIVEDCTDEDFGTQYDIPAEYPREYDDIAFGGAIYIAGDENDPRIRQIEVGFGINNSVKINDGATTLTFPVNDAFKCEGNIAKNMQNQLQSAGIRGSKGARGGAIYSGSNTSLIVAGEFIENEASAPYLLQHNVTTANRGYYAMGGAVFMEKTRNRLQVRGGPNRTLAPNNNPTIFIGNKAGAGGAIFVDNNLNDNNNFMSPIIGGTDDEMMTREYGYNIQFKDNIAYSFGGAIYTRRNFTINGAGGTDMASSAIIGYGGIYPVLFENNIAGYVGGAIDIRLPIGSTLIEKNRAVELVRAQFVDNKVGTDDILSITEENLDLRKDIRGGGALYIINGSLNVVKGVEFRANKVRNGNGGAVAMINPQSNTRRFFVTDIDVVQYADDGLAARVLSTDSVFTTFWLNGEQTTTKYPPDARMLTRFLDNTIEWDEDFLANESGSGTTQVGAGAIGTSENLNGVNFTDAKTGFVVGDNGMIIKLIEGGTEWQFKKGNTSKNLTKVKFLTTNVGFIVGKNHVILKTVDGGETWVKKYEDPMMNDKTLFDMVFTTSSVGWAVGEDGAVLKTIDGGDTWTKYDYGILNDLFSVDFTDLNYGYISGERGLILKTINGNEANPINVSWSTKISSTLQDLTSIKFTSQNVGYVIGTNGTILKTLDAGNSWFPMQSNTDANLNSFVFSDQNTCYIAADEGRILKTSNAGEIWQVINTGLSSNSLNALFFHTNSSGYVSGDLGAIIKTTDGGATWLAVEQANQSEIDAKRFHANAETTIPENGIGLGGAMYILDIASIDRATTRQDTIKFNRVRFQNNESYTGAAIYSDNFDLKLIFNRSLVSGNSAMSDIGAMQNLITGPYLVEESIDHTFNKASSDLAGAIIYGEIQGPLPSTIGHWAANSMYDNNARFLIRLPDAPNSKGVLAGSMGVGMGGTDTLRSNYWGRTEANVTMEVENLHVAHQATMETFFVDSDGERRLDFQFWNSLAMREQLAGEWGNYLFQGPFESIARFPYKAIPLRNIDDENTPDVSISIPEKLLQSGRIYDLYDKGTDIKVADYSKRRMSPIEDFAVGIPTLLDRYMPIDTTLPSYRKYIKRYVRDPFFADSVDEAYNWVYPELNSLQSEFKAKENGEFYHPIGYPLFLETMAKYETGLSDRFNLDPRVLNETVFFVINETTGDFIRANMKQLNTTSPVFRARVELVPDQTTRNPNPFLRRTVEGLLNLGTDAPGGDPKLLKALRHNPYNEDRATLIGRKYEESKDNFGGEAGQKIEDLFINREWWPETNIAGTPMKHWATFFAGERYRALPVNTGDMVRIISRSVLWREGVNVALEDGLLFEITNSTEPPVFTGDVVETRDKIITKEELSTYPWGFMDGRLDEIVIDEFQNTIFVTEDRMYPAPQLMYSDPLGARTIHGQNRFNQYVQRYGNTSINSTIVYASDGASNAKGRDRIMNVTGKDTNRFYDPRSLFVPDDYSNLYFDYVVDPSSALNKWIFKEYVHAGKVIDATKWGFDNPTLDSVYGFMIMRGRPTNPYVVPGGENLTVRVHNFPPHYRTIDSLEALPEDQRPEQDVIDKFMEIFPSYLNTPIYDTTNARYLQQDTIDLGRQYYREYTCKIYVVDSIPIFLHPDDVDENDESMWPKQVFVETNIDGDETVLGTYEPSVFPCRQSRDGRLMGNLTNKLRFQADFNTNDEQEDQWAEDINWNFRYGRTAYGFKSVSIRTDDRNGRGGDTVIIDPYVIDTTDYDGEMVLVQQRPIWMDTQFIHKYDSDSEVDEFLADFTTYGQINVRIDSAFAKSLLTPQMQYNDALNLDTLFTVVVNDGHGGINSVEMPVMINVEPEILTTTLLPAKEDIDYNPELRDNTKMIQIFDPNFYQDHWFMLAYDDDALEALGLDDLVLPDEFDRDPCFPEAGKHYLRQYDDDDNLVLDLKTTPLWLKINKESGVLYGTPGVKDAPRTPDLGNLEQVTVVVYDEDGLAAIKTFSLRVDSVNHQPGITAAPEVRCIDKGSYYEDIIYIYDKDLMRGRVEGDPTEELTITVIMPPLKVEYQDEDGNWIESNIITGIRSSDTVKVRLSSDNFSPIPDPDGRVTIRVKVEDKDGLEYTLTYKVKFSLETDFICDLTIKNNRGAENTLQFGTGATATSGYGLSEADTLGQLDPTYCEYELPPLPHEDIFDVRWTIPNSNGIYRNIFLTISPDKEGEQLIYRGRLQSGGEAGNTSNHYPVTISWNSNQIPAKDDQDRNPAGCSWYIRDAYSSGALFWFNMLDGTGFSNPDVKFNREGDIYTLTIYSDKIDAFQILYAHPVDVNEPVAGLSTRIAGVTPNPFGNMTNIEYSTQYREQVRLEVLDQLGKTVKVLVDETVAPGTYTVQWNGKDNLGNECTSGSYVCRMVTGTAVLTHPLLIVR